MPKCPNRFSNTLNEIELVWRSLDENHDYTELFILNTEVFILNNLRKSIYILTNFNV